MELNTLRSWFVIFTIGSIIVFVHAENNSADIKHQKKSIARFFKSVAKIITKHGIDVGALGTNIFELSDGPKTIYECGRRLIKYIEMLNRTKKTALTNAEKDQIEADFCSLISWISMCNTYDLWKGEFGGGSVCAAILKTSGTDPLGILGAKDGDPIRNITY